MDSIGDFLTIIRNATRVTKPFVIVQYSNMRNAIAGILKSEGFIKEFVILDKDTTKPKLQIFLKYVNGESVIHEITRISKLGRRVYAGTQEVKPVIGGLGLSILSTNRGVLTHKKAKNLGVGGEIVCTVW